MEFTWAIRVATLPWGAPHQEHLAGPRCPSQTTQVNGTGTLATPAKGDEFAAIPFVRAPTPEDSALGNVPASPPSGWFQLAMRY